MKSICFFNTIFTWGGGEKWHFEMASYMASLNYKVFFFLAKNSALDKKINNQNIKKEYVSITNFSYLNVFKVNAIASILKKHKLDVVIFNASQELKFVTLAAKKAKIKHIIYRRGSAIPLKNSFLNNYFLSSISHIIANSKATKNTINQNGSLFPEDNITVISNGIDTTKFLNSKNEEFLNSNVFTLGNLGRLVKQKNQLFLLEVAKKLKLKKVNFKMIIGGDGVLKDSLIQKRAELQLENEVQFVGFVKETKSFMEALDIFLLSSLWEGFGYVIAEAMLCEKPVIAFDSSSNPELIEHGINGYLTKENDVADFVEKIYKLYTDRNLLQKMGKRGKEKICTEFDEAIAQKKFKNFIDDLQTEKSNC